MTRIEDIPVELLTEAGRRPEVISAMELLYADADRQIAEQNATCLNRGQCCEFGTFGHRLYVTALEVVYYLAAGDPPPPITHNACPHAQPGKCTARDRRPLGCRIFYCDPNQQSWQGPLTEKYHARLRALHQELNVPYFYADWMTVLRAIKEM